MKKVLVGILMVALLAGAIVGYGVFYDRKVPNFKGTADLFVYPGMDVGEVTDSILASGCVKKPRSLRRAMSTVNEIAPGHYTIDSTRTSMYVSRMIHGGWQTPVMLTLSGSIRTYRALARKIGSQMLADSASIASFCADSLGSFGLDTAMLFTRIIPDSYQMKWTSAPRAIFDRLTKEIGRAHV